ncbi:hypothetical protein AB1Y20_008852 [Prymnesium parvum]|uniref:Uncharacterized protein n=1 Tax=Prymnesium parvum TaxID=97485 RepID=A0AB34IUK3_PRYPA
MFLNTGASTSSGSAKFRAANTQPLRSEFGTVAPPDLDLDFACSSWTHHASKPPEHRKRVAASGKELASDQRRSLVSASRQPRSAPSENVPREHAEQELHLLEHLVPFYLSCSAASARNDARRFRGRAFCGSTTSTSDTTGTPASHR